MGWQEKGFKGAVLALAALTAASSTSADEAAAPGPNFVAADQLLGSGGIRLANGKAVSASDWQAVAIARGALNCTASLVGREVILTSAHCVDAKPYAQMIATTLGSVTFGGPPIALTECSAHPSYGSAGPNDPFPRSGNDIALCRLATAIDDVTMETIGFAPPSRDEALVLMGFGCKRIDMGSRGPAAVPDPPKKPILRLGDQTVQATGLALGTSGPLLSRTTSLGDKPNICPGDSGGPVFTGVTTATLARSRRIAALNSAFDADWGEDVPVTRFYSYLAPLGPSFRSWADAWAAKRSLTICGINRDGGLDGCRL